VPNGLNRNSRPVKPSVVLWNITIPRLPAVAASLSGKANDVCALPPSVMYCVSTRVAFSPSIHAVIVTVDADKLTRG